MEESKAHLREFHERPVRSEERRVGGKLTQTRWLSDWSSDVCSSDLRNGFEVTLQPQMLELPLKWKSPKRIFVNSMSDLFHAEVPRPYIRDVFDIMRRAHWHQY